MYYSFQALWNNFYPYIADRMLTMTFSVTAIRYQIQFFYYGKEECNTLTNPALAEESTSGKGMTSTKHSKVLREGFSSNLGPYFCPWDKFLTTCSTNKLSTCIYFETKFNKRDYLTVGRCETHYAVSNNNFFLAAYQYYILLYPCFRFSGTYLNELDRLLLSKSSSSPTTSGILWFFHFCFFFLHSKQIINIWCKMYRNVFWYIWGWLSKNSTAKEDW